MARWFDFSNDEYEFKSLGSLCRLWEKVPDRQAVNSIAEAHQYFDFIRIMIIERLQSWSHPIGDRESWFTPTPLVLSGRAGAISSCIVAGTSDVQGQVLHRAFQLTMKALNPIFTGRLGNLMFGHPFLIGAGCRRIVQ